MITMFTSLAFAVEEAIFAACLGYALLYAITSFRFDMSNLQESFRKKKNRVRFFESNLIRIKIDKLPIEERLYITNIA